MFAWISKYSFCWICFISFNHQVLFEPTFCFIIYPRYMYINEVCTAVLLAPPKAGFVICWLMRQFSGPITVLIWGPIRWLIWGPTRWLIWWPIKGLIWRHIMGPIWGPIKGLIWRHIMGIRGSLQDPSRDSFEDPPRSSFEDPSKYSFEDPSRGDGSGPEKDPLPRGDRYAHWRGPILAKLRYLRCAISPWLLVCVPNRWCYGQIKVFPLIDL